MSSSSITGIYSDVALPLSRHDYTVTSANVMPSIMAFNQLETLYDQNWTPPPLLLQRSSPLGPNSSFNASAVLAAKQQYQIQVVAATFSSITVLSSVCAVYWFCLMRRNFRRDLILLLIIGDVWKSLWFLIFSAVTLARGHISTSSPFCQACGYLVQTGIESCDVAIFLIGLHMTLQIFPPKNSFLGHDGLYRARFWAFGAWIVLPNLSASLAFINQSGYISQGGFCTLPIRPFWYRLALAWIPRYLIWIFVMGVAIRIYRHVGYEFKVFAQERDQTSSTGIPVDVSTVSNTIASHPTVAMDRTASAQSDGATIEKQTYDHEASLQDVDPRSLSVGPRLPETAHFLPSRAGRRQSVPNWTMPFRDDPTFDTHDPLSVTRISQSTPSSRRGSKQFAAGRSADGSHSIAPMDVSHLRVAFVPPRPTVVTASHDALSPTLSPIIEYKTYQSTKASTSGNAATRALDERRRAIQRQVRVLFIYPIVYLIFWVMPFVAHCFTYSNYYAQHPIFALSVLNVFCQTFMGFADVCIFSWRERPWRHIPGSNGTFSGSFMFWRIIFASRSDTASRLNFAATSPIVPIAPTIASPDASAPAGDSPTDTTFHSGSRTGSSSSFLHSIKHWSMNMSGLGGSQPALQRGSDASAATAATAPHPPRRTFATTTTSIHRRAFSGGVSDRRMRDAELAHERLALERADWALNQQVLHDRPRRASAISTLQSGERKEPERKEWWDRQMSLDDDLRDDE